MRTGPVDVAGAIDLAIGMARRIAGGDAETDIGRAMCDWAAERSVPARLQPVGPLGANILIGPDDGPELAFYGHLDTSLRLGPWSDALLVAEPAPPLEPHCDGEMVWGAGIGVALAPTAAGLAVVASLTELAGPERVGALIASGGTHRAPPPWPATPQGPMHARMGAGVAAALDAGFRPGAVISVKGGAPAPLWEEPGSLYIEVSLREEFGPALNRAPAQKLPGAPAATAAATASIERWRQLHLAQRRDREGQAGAEVALGALLAGSPSKPDVLPDTSRLYLYVVTVPDDDSGAITESLRRHLRSDPELRAVGIDVIAYGWLPAGATDASHPLVRSVTAAWERRLPLREVSGWRGSTDGALLRARGVPTVRAGPELLRHPNDPRVEGVRVADLESFCELWWEAARSYLGC